MRKFNTFCGLMPCALIEFKAQVVKNSGDTKEATGSIAVCRFGISCCYKDCTTWWYHMESENPTLKEAVAKARELLAEHGETMEDERYTGNELTESVINANTWIVPTDNEYIGVYERYNKLLSECYHQSWYRVNSGTSHPNHVGLDNIAGIPELFNCTDRLLQLTSDNKILVANHIDFDDESHKASVTFYKCDDIDKIKADNGFGDKPDIEFINHLVERLLDESKKCDERKEMKLREAAAVMATAAELGRAYLEALCGNDQEEIDYAFLRYRMIGSLDSSFQLVDSVRRLVCDSDIKPQRFLDVSGKLYGVRFSLDKGRFGRLIEWLQGIEKDCNRIAKSKYNAWNSVVSLPATKEIENCVCIDYSINTATSSSYYHAFLFAELKYTTDEPENKITGESKELPGELAAFLSRLTKTPKHIDCLKC